MGKKNAKGGKVAAAGRATSGKAVKAGTTKSTKAKAPKTGEPVETKVSQAELDTLCKAVEEAKGGLEKAHAEANALTDKAHALVAEAKDTYRAALVPYREACRKAGVECEYEGGRRSANVSAKVSFLVEKTDKGVRVMVKGQPKTEELIPFAELKESINKTAYAYTEKHLGPKEEIGNKGGSLSNRLRAILG